MPHDNTLDEIKDRVDIVEFISEYVSLKKAGQNWKGLCPFHAEKTPSFTVSPAKQIFHCFGCRSGGDVFTFLMQYENLSFPEALRALAERAGVTLRDSGKGRAARGEKDLQLQIHRDALTFFREQLPRNRKATEYLDSRGIDEAAQKLFSIGYAPPSWNALIAYLEQKGYTTVVMKKAGLAIQGTKGFYATFRDRIIFPIIDLKGNVIAFGGRSFDGSDPKYLNSPETMIFSKGSVLYGLYQAKDSIKKTGRVLFMEGYIDVITSFMHGFTNAVAPLGTAFTREHGKLIKRFTEDVVLVFDSDAAGARAARNASALLLEQGLAVHIVNFPGNDDPDSFLRREGREGLEALLRQPLSIIDFFIRQEKDRHNAAQSLMELILKIPNRVLQGEYIKQLAEKLSVKEEFVWEEFQRVSKQGAGRTRKPASTARTRPPRRPLDEEYILQLLIQIPEKAEEVFSILSPDDFRDEAIRNIIDRIRLGTTGLNELISQSSGQEKAILTEISMREDFEYPGKVLDDCIRRLRKNRRDIQLQDLQKRISEAEGKKDFALLRELQAEQHRLLRS